MSDVMHDSSAPASSSAVSGTVSVASSHQTSPERCFPTSASQNNTNPSVSRQLSFGSSHQVSEQDSDPPIVSPAIESDDSTSSEGSRVFSSNLGTNDSETDDDSFFENGIGTWLPANTPGVIHVNIKSRDQDRMNHTADEIQNVLTNIKHRCGLKSNATLTREICLRFFVTRYLIIVSSYAEEMRITYNIRERPVGFDEVCSFLQIVIMSMFYKVAPGTLFDRGPAIYGLMNMAKLQKQRFFLIWRLLQMKRKRAEITIPIMDSFLSQLEECVSNTVNVCFSAHNAVVSLDDDKLPFTKNLARDLGLKSFKIKERCSVVQHCLVSLNTRLFLGGHMNGLTETHKDCVNWVLGNVSGARTNPMQALPESLLVTMDRAYSHIALDPSVTLGTLTTVKRGRVDFPFTFGGPSRSRRENGPQHVHLIGMQALYYAVKPDGAFAVAWRDQERVTLLQTTNTHITPEDWDYVPNRPSLVEHEKRLRTPVYIQFMPNRQILTLGQRTADWFVAKRFQITSTVASPILHLWLSGFAYVYSQQNRDVTISLQKVEKLGRLLTKRTCAQGVDESRRALLKKMSKPQLLEVARAMNDIETEIRPSWKKGRIIDALLHQMPLNDPIFEPLQNMTTIEQALLDAWFKKSPRAKHFHECLDNESVVRMNLKDFVNSVDSPSTNQKWVIVDVQEIGLTRSADLENHHACASLDGIVLLSKGRSTVLCGLEIKTRIGKAETKRICALRESCGQYNEVKLNFHSNDASLFQKFVPDPGYRVQLLHHIASCNLERIMYVESTKTEIVFVVVFDFGMSVKESYISHFLRPVGLIIKNMMKEIEQLTPTSAFATRLKFKYLVDAWTLRQHFELHRALERKRTEGILPSAKVIRPAIVSCWNSLKGGTDVYSRVMSHLRPRVQGSLMGQLTLRFFVQLIVNAERVFKLSLVQNNLSDFMCIQQLWRRLNIDSVQSFLLDAVRELCVFKCAKADWQSPPCMQNRNFYTNRTTNGRSKLSTKRKQIVCERKEADDHIPIDASSPSRGISVLGFSSSSEASNRRARCKVCCRECPRTAHEMACSKHYRSGYMTSTYCLACTREANSNEIIYLCDKVRHPLVSKETCFDIWHSDIEMSHPFIPQRPHIEDRRYSESMSFE